MLDLEAQRLFAICGVFIGGFTYDALHQVAIDRKRVAQGMGLHHQHLRDGLQALLDQSLLQKQEVRGQVRYLMLETIRQFGGEQLHASGDEQTISARHAHYFRRLAQRTDAERDQRVQAHLYVQLVEEQPNLRAALHWLLEHQPRAGLRMANTLRGFWYACGFAGEGRRWLQAAIGANPQPSSAQAQAWYGIAFLANLQGDLTSAEPAVASALQIFQSLGDESMLADCLLERGLARYRAQQFGEAEQILARGAADRACGR